MLYGVGISRAIAKLRKRSKPQNRIAVASHQKRIVYSGIFGRDVLHDPIIGFQSGGKGDRRIANDLIPEGYNSRRILRARRTN